MAATLENTEGYTQADLDRFNAMVEAATADMEPSEAEATEKHLSDKYLTDAPEGWDF